MEGFVIVDFRNDADVAAGEPFPSADDVDTAVIAIAFDIDTGALGDYFRSGTRERQLVASRRGAMACGDIAAGVADEQLQDRARVFLVGQEAEQNEAVVEAAVRDHAGGFIDGVGFAGLAKAAEAHDAAEFFIGINAESKDTDDLETVVADGRGDDHRGHAGAGATGIVFHGDDAGERGRNVGDAI